jgi:membrane associated rhomboid family serine protease
MQKYFNELNKKQADLVLLILESQGINADSVKASKTFDIIVKERDEKFAVETLNKYFTENTNLKEKVAVAHFSWRSPAVFLIMLFLCIVHLYSQHNGIHGHLVKEFGSSGLYIMHGDYYRAVSALFFHADIEHLAGNLVGMFVFATGVFSLTGYGKGSLMLLLSGFFGNITTAYFKKGAYLSIGASTSVLGAAGILTALQIVKKRDASLSNIQIFAPFAAGMALLGFLSGGENTDISAHLFGFIWGFFIGAFYTAITKKQNNKSDNVIYACIAVTIIMAAGLKSF